MTDPGVHDADLGVHDADPGVHDADPGVHDADLAVHDGPIQAFTMDRFSQQCGIGAERGPGWSAWSHRRLQHCSGEATKLPQVIRLTLTGDFQDVPVLGKRA